MEFGELFVLIMALTMGCSLGAYSFGWWWRGRHERDR